MVNINNNSGRSLTTLTTVGHVNASLTRTLGTSLSAQANDMLSTKLSQLLDFVDQAVPDDQRATFSALFSERCFTDVDEVRVTSALLDGWLNGVLAAWSQTGVESAGQYV